MELWEPGDKGVRCRRDWRGAADERVAYELAKVRRFYGALGLSGRAEIEFFNGPHEIHGEGTFRFLRKHLSWEQ